jgi:hypothetical protein
MGLRGATGSARGARFLVLLLAALLALFSFAATAVAQTAAGADEYIAAGPATGTGGPAASDGSGSPFVDPCACPAELPFTGYPLTSLAAICAALLLAGGLLRLAIVLRERAREGSAQSVS